MQLVQKFAQTILAKLTLNDASGVEPGWVEIIPRKRVTCHVRTWLYSEHTEMRNFSDSVTFVTGLWCTVKVWNS